MSNTNLARGLWLCSLLALVACSSDAVTPAPQATAIAGTLAMSSAGANAGVAGNSSLMTPMLQSIAGASAPTTTPAAGSGAAASAAGSGAVPSSPTFTRVWTEVLMIKGCSGEYCHGSGTGSLMLKNKRIAYDALVNVPAAGPACAGKGVRVMPGMPDASLLLDKLSHPTPSCGDTMPVGAKLAPNCLSTSPPVCTTEAEISLVREWILAGAKDD